MRSLISENVPLARFTTWRVGGYARWYCEPKVDEFGYVLDWARSNACPVYCLGRGSNILVPDEGVDGLVIHTRNSLRGLSVVGANIYAESGVSLPRLAKFAAAHGCAGYEFLIGIPGTVGGGVCMNAGTTAFHPREIADVIVDASVIDREGKCHVLSRDSLGFNYRQSLIQQDGAIVVSARFSMAVSGDPSAIRIRTLEHLAERKRKQPLDKPTAGSTFKACNGKPAAWYIDTAGLKGAIVGGASVSNKHANWIENSGEATARDIANLIDLVRSTVLRIHGVALEPEVRWITGARV
ncbi:UDP-N-acetylmuramate dehydrogenase [Cerasicoccus maritimus]|uniref:UDP-N-acetylmuramate dehydrogenase n=1 Tax=Cerasicoccus maritimus TaxID=490089 RepID=UPI002852DA05|nr:UDP-N-acetylmuramate dehydrogenase [Cerasicoccus maritimus]